MLSLGFLYILAIIKLIKSKLKPVYLTIDLYLIWI